MKFTKDHEWVRLEGDVATVGITKHAADQLGDVVFVEVPDAGKAVSKGDGFAVVGQKGSEHRDEMTPEGFLANHSGGITGGQASVRSA